MAAVCFIFAMMLTSGLASPLPEATTIKQDTNATNVSLPATNLPQYVIVPLDDIIFGLDQNTIVQFNNLQLSIPADLRIGENDPDFSKMILNVNSSIDYLEIAGDYDIIVYGYLLPISSQGHIHMKLKNVSVTGETPLALTPAALLALSYDFVYTPQAIDVEINPHLQNMATEEVRLAKEVLKEPVITLVKNQIDSHLNYYTEAYINMVLSKISVFTVGHKKEESFIKDPFNQNVQIGDLFDELLADVQRVVTEKEKDEINVSNFAKNFTEKLETTYVKGEFFAEAGWVSGLSSLRRFSNVSLAKKEDIFILSAGVEFDHLKMGYDEYKASFLKMKIIGELEGTFLHTKMIMKVSMNPKDDGTCHSSLSELRAFNVNGYKITSMTNIGSLDWLQAKINNWLIGYFQTKIIREVEKELVHAVHKSLNQFDCGEYLPHLKLLL